jgi:hypothetical protein
MKALTYHGKRDVRVDTVLPLLSGDGDPLGVDTFATHQKKEDGAFKVVFKP